MQLEPGAELGHYTLVEKIGEGAMGVVWRARDCLLGREVALKVLPEGLAGDEGRLARFEREAQAVAALNHPNIVTLHSVEEHEGRRFITMELVKGRTLRSLIPPEGLAARDLIELALPLLDALNQAHAHGITHRDLKPDNVMVDEDGRLRVLDFGLATTADVEKETDRDAATLLTTEVGTVVGTPHYMSPEQATGQAVDERSDLFSVGVILHELATGRRPFEGDSAVAVLSSILKDPAPDLSELQPRHPKQLARIVGCCLEKNPERRCQTARSLSAQLEALGLELSASASSASSRRRLALVALVAVVTTALALFAVTGGSEEGAGESAVPERRVAQRTASIAVLPFVNSSGGEENEYFSDGMTDELINALGRIDGLRVPARTTIFSLKGKGLSVAEVGERLNVDHVLEGTVFKAGDQIKIRVQLVLAGDEFEVWSGSYERDYGDVFAIQEEIAQALVSALELRLVGGGEVELVGRPTQDLEAYDYYLRGRYYLHRGLQADLLEAVRLFGKAIERDPHHARAHVGLARAHYWLSNRYDRPRDRMPKARAAALRAIELDPNLAEAHAALGAIQFDYDWDWEATRARAQRALELDPKSADGHVLMGWLLVSQGDFEGGVPELLLAEELDPLSGRRIWEVAIGLFMAGEFEAAERVARRGIALREEDALAHSALALVAPWAGKLDEALVHGRRAVELEPAVDNLEMLAGALALAGEQEEARDILETVLRRVEESYACPYEVATLFLILGDRDSAIDWFDKAVEERADCWVWGNVDPRMEELRQDARYQEQLRRVGHSLD